MDKVGTVANSSSVVVEDTAGNSQIHFLYYYSNVPYIHIL